MSINNAKFVACLHLIYPNLLAWNKKNTTNTLRSTSFFDLILEILSGKLKTRLYDKRNELNVPIANFQFIDINMPEWCVHFTTIRYSRSCNRYSNFLYRSLLMTTKLFKQGFNVPGWMLSLQKFYSRHHDLIDRYGNLSLRWTFLLNHR